ncbi:MAG: hypothetical protein F6K28_22490 [Microcoleus sp. SIO2G3]|nr:hypothetical protein [Microcoleus sp. SIO2G3]
MIFLKKLKLQQQNQPLSVLVFSVVIYITGLTFMGFGGVSTLTCQRQGTSSTTLKIQNTCTLDNSSFVTPRQQDIALADLLSAELKRHSRSYHVAYQVVLLTQSDEIPLMNSSPTDRNAKVAMVDEINQFLQNPEQQQLHLQLEDSRYSSIFGFLLIATGIGSRLFARQIISCLSAISNEAG